jgi:ELWxxDGT repeat protein
MAMTIQFSAQDQTSGSELWSSDGTAAGTRLVADIILGAQSSTPNWLTALGGRALFFADDACMEASPGSPTAAPAGPGSSLRIPEW